METRWQLVKAEVFEVRSHAGTLLICPLWCQCISPGIKTRLLSITLGFIFHCEWLLYPEFQGFHNVNLYSGLILDKLHQQLFEHEIVVVMCIPSFVYDY